MTYQQARRIRNKDYSLTNLITRNIRNRDMGAGQSIKEAFKEKFDVKTRLKAKVTGIKEKFDILNIAKFLTGGSNVAPALLGKILGRSKADIRNFTGGRQSYEDYGAPTATKIGRDPHAGGGDQTGMSEVLEKILELQQRTYDNIKEQRERLNNFKEEKELEADKRHKALLDAIKGFSPGEKQTAEKVKDSGGMDMSSIIQSILSAFGGARTAMSALSLLGTFAASPIGALFIAALVAGTVGSWMVEQIKADPKAALEGKGGIGMAVAGLGSESQIPTPTFDEETRKKLAASVDSKGLKESTVEELQAKKADILDVGVDPRIKQKKGMTLDDVDKKRLTQINAIDAEIAAKQKTAGSAETATPAGSTNAASPTPTSGPTATPEPAAPATPPAATPASPTAAPAATTPPSQQLNAVTNENRTAKIDSMATSPTTTTNNVVAKNQPKKMQEKDGIPAVRNMEATLQRMIYNSTRIV